MPLFDDDFELDGYAIADDAAAELDELDDGEDAYWINDDDDDDDDELDGELDGEL